MNFQQIEKRLQDPRLDAQWRQYSTEWQDTDEPGRWRALAHVASRRDHCMRTLKEISDEEQLTETLAIVYIELKAEWIMLNTLVNYQLFNKGAGEGEYVLRGALVASLLGEVEKLLSAENIKKITDFLATPISKSEGKLPQAKAA